MGTLLEIGLLEKEAQSDQGIERVPFSATSGADPEIFSGGPSFRPGNVTTHFTISKTHILENLAGGVWIPVAFDLWICLRSFEFIILL